MSHEGTRYDHRKHVWKLPESTCKVINQAIDEYKEHETYIITSSANGTYIIDDEELFEALGLRR